MPEDRQQLPGTARPLAVHSIAQFDTAALACTQHQLEETKEEFENLRQTTSEQQLQLKDTNDEVEGLREMACEQQEQLEEMNDEIEGLCDMGSEQQDEVEEMNEEIESLRETISEQQEQLDAASRQMELFESFIEETVAREIIMEIIERVRPLESDLGVSRRLSSLEERLDSIISITSITGHEIGILRTAMEQMGKDLEKMAIITGIVAKMVTAAFVHFYFL